MAPCGRYRSGTLSIEMPTWQICSGPRRSPPRCSAEEACNAHPTKDQMIAQYYLDNVTLANPRLRERRIAWTQAPSSLWEDPEFSETTRRNLPWNRATS